MATLPSKVYSPSKQRISVVLPAPLEPIRATSFAEADIEADTIEYTGLAEGLGYLLELDHGADYRCARKGGH